MSPTAHRLHPRGASGGMRRRWHAFASARQGVTAVEFAFVAPLLLLLFLAAIEVPRAIATNNRLARATGAMTDLVARADYADLNDVFAAADVIATPYSLIGAGIVLTAGGVYQDGDAFIAKVCSSVQQRDQARAVGSAIGPPPPGTGSKGDRFIMAEARLSYRPLFTFFPFLNGLTFTGKTVWPIREGNTYNGQAEIVLPGGKPCPP